ncbi:MAG: carbon dioxide concentrating mechanism protein CcmL [Planctomyces sp.]|nr:carbon dioxide concentrating mechanism protein CcmL [Planctomyces sp.]
MRIGRVIGKLTLSRGEESVRGARWLVVEPFSLAGLRGDPAGVSEELIVYDELGATEGQMIAISEGAEAAGPFHPDQKPIDAYCAAILDTIHLEP